MGGGTIGNLVGQALKALGAEKVLLSEVSACRLEKAKEVGLLTVNPLDKSLKDAIFDEFGPDGTDVIFECIGNAKTLNEAVVIARKGSTVIVMGVVADGKIKLDTLITQHIAFDDYEEAYHLIDREKDKAMKVIIDL